MFRIPRFISSATEGVAAEDQSWRMRPSTKGRAALVRRCAERVEGAV
jgi:hypothetical protein